MTNQEFSNEFDVLYNSITSNNAPGLDEYEKSVFLTKAQSEILKEYFNSRVDGTNGGFDGSQKRQYDFSSLITTTTLDAYTNDTPLDSRSKSFVFPVDYFLSVNEIIKGQDNVQYSVISISYSDYQRLMTKPYAYPPKKSVWRLFTTTCTRARETQADAKDECIVAEVIGKTGDSIVYTLRYVRKPNPIILLDLSDDDVSIDGEQQESPCELPTQLHQEILERAVTLAKIAYQGGSTSTLASQANRNNQQQQ